MREGREGGREERLSGEEGEEGVGDGRQKFLPQSTLPNHPLQYKHRHVNYNFIGSGLQNQARWAENSWNACVYTRVRICIVCVVCNEYCMCNGY